MAPLAEGKATGFLTPARVLAEMAPAEYPRFLALLPSATRALIESPPLPTCWLPLYHFPEIVSAALSALGNSVERLAELAERSLRADLNSIYRVFVRIASPEFVLDRAPGIWGTYTRNAGTITVTERGERSRVITYRDVPFPSAAYWNYQRGAARGLVRATGVKTGEVTICDGKDGANYCSLRVRW